MTRGYDAAHMARHYGKSENWWKRNAARLPHHKLGQTYFWTDEDVAEILRRAEGGRGPDSSSELRPMTGRRRSA